MRRRLHICKLGKTVVSTLLLLCCVLTGCGRTTEEDISMKNKDGADYADAYIDLHLHLDGAITVDIAKQLAELQDITLPAQEDDALLALLSVPEDCESLNDFLNCFALPLSLMQTREGISEAVRLVMENIKSQNVIYAEIRFAPQLHTQQGLTQEDAVQAAIEGLKRSDLPANLILCCMRGEDTRAANLETVELAKKYLVETGGVVAIDLAGAEALYPTEDYRDIFALATSYGIPFTIHAGEAAGAESIQTAISMGAKRIGHGVRINEDSALMELVQNKGIFLKMCPTSNRQTRAVADMSTYPLIDYLNMGIRVTLNTDDMAISRTSLPQEFRYMEKHFGLTGAQLNDSAYTIGVAQGAASQTVAEQALPNAKIKYYTRDADAYLAVEQKKIDAFVYDRVTMEFAIASGLTEVKLLPDELGEPIQIAVGISPKSPIPDLETKINTFISQSREDGTLDDMFQRWVYEAADTIPDIPKPENPTLTLKVATSGLVQPFSYYKGDQLCGYDIEFIYRFALWMNADVEISTYDYGGIYAPAEAGSIDCIIANLNVTEERKQSILFSDTIYESYSAVMVQEDGSSAETAGTQDTGTATAYTDASQLNGKTLAVITGSIIDQTVSSVLPNASFSYFNSASDCVASLKSGKVEGFPIDAPMARLYVSLNPDLNILPGELVESGIGMAFPKGSDLTALFNREIVRLKQSGFLDELADKWMGADNSVKTLPTLTSTGENGTLWVACASTTEPMCYVGADGTPTGYDVELLLHIAQTLGKKVELIPVDFGGLTSMLESGKADVAIGCLTISDERRQLVDMTDSYYDGGTVMVVRGGDAAAESRIPLENANFGVMTGSTAEVYLADTYPAAAISTFSAIPDALTALSNGKVDYVMTAYTTSLNAVQLNPSLEIAQKNVVMETSAIAVSKGNPELLSSLVAALVSGKADVVISNMTPTEERRESVSFTQSYFDNPQVLVARKVAVAEPAAEGEYTSLSQLSGKMLSCITGSIFDQLTLTAIPDAQFSYFNNATDELAALRAGKVEGIPIDGPVAELWAAQNSDLAIVPEIVVEDHYAVALAKDSPLTADFNREIAVLKEQGVLDEMYDKWISADNSGKTMPSLDYPAPNGTIRVACSVALEPMCYAGSDGKPMGFDVELVVRVAQALGKKVELISVDFGGLIPMLQSGKADVSVGCMSISEERKQSVDLTDSYYDGGMLMVVRKVGGGAEDNTGFWGGLKQSFIRTFVTENRWKLVLDGLVVTVVLSVCSGLLGSVLGFGICMLRRSKKKITAIPAAVFIRIIQGTPIVVLLMILYYIIFGKLDISAILVAILGFAVNFGVYVSEMIRTGIDAVDKGQIEAAHALGFTRMRTFWKITFPQAARHFLPVFKGEFISMVKMTSVVGYIAIQDLTKVSDIIRSRTLEAFFPLIATAVLYFIVANILTILLSRLEISLDPKRRKRGVKGVVTK